MIQPWERARTGEQKEIREEEIFTAAKELLLEQGFAEVTLSKIADKISFSRANLYKYYNSTEEVYLALLGQEMLSFSYFFLEKAKRKKFPDQKRPTIIAEFTKDWIAVTEKQTCLRLLLSMATTILEKNSTETVFIESKKATTAATITLLEAISYYFPKMDEVKATELLTFLMITLSGLTTSTGLSLDQKKVLKKEGMGIMVLEFKRTYGRLITQYLS